MTITPTKAVLGATISDIDLSETLSNETVTQLQTAFHEHSVLIFHNQILTEDDQVRFTRYFCDPVQHPTNTTNRGSRPEITIISNTKEGALGNAEVNFHADLIFLPTPCTVSALYCLETPDHGGNTYWTGNIAAYEALDTDMQNRLEGLEIAYIHSRPEYNPPKPPRHPLVTTHPESKRKSLYFSPNHAKWIEGLPDPESQELITYLSAHLTSDQFTLSHHWHPGDLVIWDNRCTMHRRDSFDNAHTRIMKRTQATGMPSD